MIGVEVKVYGSVCVGLAARDSDVDVTVGEGILEQGWGYLEDISDRISGFFSICSTTLPTTHGYPT